MLGYVTPNSWTNRRAGALSRSRVFRPTNCTDGPSSFDAATRSGASFRHGAHHEPHTFRTTTLPVWSARLQVLPSSVVPLSAGACSRLPAAKTDTLPDPLTNPFYPCRF